MNQSFLKLSLKQVSQKTERISVFSSSCFTNPRIQQTFVLLLLLFHIFNNSSPEIINLAILETCRVVYILIGAASLTSS